MTHHPVRHGRVGALFCAAAITVGSFASFAPMASANTATSASTGSITVYKLQQPEGNLGPNDGSKIDASKATPLVAGFTACAIDGIDLSKPSDWTRLSKVTATLDAEGKTVASEGGQALTASTCTPEQKTDKTTGATTFAGLTAQKAYVVSETTAAQDAVTVSQPTVLTVPYPGNGATGTDEWNYDPVIYPKNVIAGAGATKDGKIIGNKVTFDVNVPINPLADKKLYTQLGITDQLSNTLTYTGASVALKSSTGAAVALDPADYTLSAPSTNPGDKVDFAFATSGLAKVNATIGGTAVLTINADAIATGTTNNQAQITVNGKTSDEGPKVPDPKNYFDGAHVLKQAQNKRAAEVVPLADAHFDVYTAADDATGCPTAPDATQTKVLAEEVSGADGTTPKRVLAEGNYCAYETTVPAGYKGMTGGTLLAVHAEDASVTVLNKQIGTDEGDLPGLPITGSQGAMMLLGGGAVLLLIGGGLATAKRRKESHEQAV